MFRTVSIYRPNKNKLGTLSVYAQHKRYLLQQTKDGRDPIDAWMEDFSKELQSWLNMGDQIVVQGNVNESVFHESIKNLFEE